MRSFDEIMLEAEERVSLMTSLRVRRIEFNEDATTAELAEMRKNAPFDARFDEVNYKMRATVAEHAFAYRTMLDGVVVGRGGLKSCQALADELNTSDEKCDALKRILA